MSERAATTGCAPAPRRAILRGAVAHGVGADDGDREPRPVRPELRVEGDSSTAADIIPIQSPRRLEQGATMNPYVGRDLPRFGQPEHVHRRPVAARAAKRCLWWVKKIGRI